MSTDSPKHTYRVVGIRNDGTRAILAKDLTADRAQAVVRELQPLANAFHSVVAEPEEPPAR